jgi:hypothetical protein
LDKYANSYAILRKKISKIKALKSFFQMLLTLERYTFGAARAGLFYFVKL